MYADPILCMTEERDEELMIGAAGPTVEIEPPRF